MRVGGRLLSPRLHPDGDRVGCEPVGARGDVVAAVALSLAPRAAQAEPGPGRGGGEETEQGEGAHRLDCQDYK